MTPVVARPRAPCILEKVAGQTVHPLQPRNAWKRVPATAMPTPGPVLVTPTATPVAPAPTATQAAPAPTSTSATPALTPTPVAATPGITPTVTSTPEPVDATPTPGPQAMSPEPTPSPTPTPGATGNPAVGVPPTSGGGPITVVEAMGTTSIDETVFVAVGLLTFFPLLLFIADLMR